MSKGFKLLAVFCCGFILGIIDQVFLKDYFWATFILMFLAGWFSSDIENALYK